MIKEIATKDLKASFDSKKLNCRTTEELKPLEGIIGQDRAVRSLKFGLNIRDAGFNIYVSGYTGTGRTTGVREFVKEIARTKPVPPDWCYVNNFKNAYEPNAIKLPPGRGKKFQDDVKNFIDSIRDLLPKTFESKDYNEKKNVIVKTIQTRKDKLLNDLNKRAQDAGFVLKTTQIGLFIVPVVNGKILNEQDFLGLSEDKKNEIKSKRGKINEELKKTMDSVRVLDKQASQELKKLNHDVALYTIEKFIEDIKEEYSDVEEVGEFIEEVKNDILNNINIFISGQASQGAAPAAQAVFPWMKELPFKKYEVNLIVDNSNLKGAPVVIEQNPTYQNLFGRIEKEAQFGVLTTDFTMIRAGSIHKANHGFLVIPVEELINNIKNSG